MYKPKQSIPHNYPLLLTNIYHPTYFHCISNNDILSKLCYIFLLWEGTAYSCVNHLTCNPNARNFFRLTLTSAPAQIVMHCTYLLFVLATDSSKSTTDQTSIQLSATNLEDCNCCSLQFFGTYI